MDGVDFDPARTFKHGSQTSTARTQGVKFEIVTLGFKTNVEPYTVERVIGHDPVRQFLTAAPGGRWQAHEVSYDSHSNQWFNVYGNEDRQPGEWGHWTGRGMNWNSMCAECHNTRLRKNYDAASDSYHTTMAEMSVGCEACHGPLKAHVEWRKTHPKTAAKDSTIAPMNPARTLDTCGSCHSRRDNLTGNFQPGDSFFDHYSLQILDEAERWYPDGQVKDEDYEFSSFLSSRMHQSGVTCRDCHDPHSGKTRAQGNELCMRCHNGSVAKVPVINPADHAHHKLDGKGGECISCHMPVTVYMQRHSRHDHGFTIPDPLLTKQAEIPNACNRCHADKSVEWTLEFTEKWYGAKMNRHTRERAQWIAAAQHGDESAKDKLAGMLTDGIESPYWRAVAASLLWQWANDSGVKTALLAALKDREPLVREKAIHSLEGLKNAMEMKAALTPRVNESSRNVRVAAAWALRGITNLQSRAEGELQAALDLDADQPSGLYRRAVFELAQRRPTNALAHLQRAISFDPYSPPLRLTAAELLNQLGRTNEASEQFERAKGAGPSGVHP